MDPQTQEENNRHEGGGASFFRGQAKEYLKRRLKRKAIAMGGRIAAQAAGRAIVAGATALFSNPITWVVIGIIIFVILFFLLVLTTGHADPPPPPPPPVDGVIPSKWPDTLQIGVGNINRGPLVSAAGLKGIANFGFRYTYIAGGVGVGADGIATAYIKDSIDNSMIPIFTYYMICQSGPGGDPDCLAREDEVVFENLNRTSTMQTYFNELIDFFKKAAAFPDALVVLHLEPDMWGLMQNRTGDSAASYSVKVGSTGIPELSGFADNGSGLAQAIVKLRNTYAPNVLLAYALTIWSTGVSFSSFLGTDDLMISSANRAADFYKSLSAPFDLSFAEFSDRDAAYHVIEGGRDHAWWNPEDYDKHILYMGTYSRATGQRIVFWQIPLGNNIMRAEDNTFGHYQDTIVPTLLGDPGRTRLNQYISAGAIGFLFGSGYNVTTHNFDNQGDGVTDPPPTDFMGSTTSTLSFNADDDGGYFNAKVKEYYDVGPLPLPAGSMIGPPTPTPTPAPVP